MSSVYIKLSSSSLKIYAYSVCNLCFNTNFTHNIDDNGELTYDPSPEFCWQPQCQRMDEDKIDKSQTHVNPFKTAVRKKCIG